MPLAPEIKDPLRRVWRNLSPRRHRDFLALTLLMLVGAGAEVSTLGAAVPFLGLIAQPSGLPARGGVWKWVAAITGSPHSVLVATGIFAACALAAGAFRIFMVWKMNRFAFDVGHDLGRGVYGRGLRRPYLQLISSDSSELISAIGKVQTLTFGVLLPFMQSLTAIVLAFFIMAALLLIAPIVSLAAFFVFGGLYLGVRMVSSRTLAEVSRNIASAQTLRIQAVQDGLGGIRDIILDRTESSFLDRFGHHDKTFGIAQATSNFLAVAPRFAIEAFGMVLIAGLAAFMQQRPGGLAVMLPTLGALAIGAQRLLPLMQTVYNGLAQIAANRHLMGDVLTFLEAPTRPESPALKGALPFTREITFRDVTFRYAPDAPPVLNGISFTLPKGKWLAITGKTGVGKSTLVDILMGFMSPTAGSVEIDGRSLDDSTIGAWQARVAHVPQTIFLSNASISENIAFGVPPERIDAKLVEEAAKRAMLSDFVDQLPDGLETIVGERGALLSGGQRQRIGIARALYKRAEVLVFDEATNALDSTTEASVLSALATLRGELTVVSITHRERPLLGCDYRLELPDGIWRPLGSGC